MSCGSSSEDPRAARDTEDTEDTEQESAAFSVAKSGAITRAFALVGQLGLTVAAGGLLGTLAGYGLDRWLGTAPGFLIGGLLFGLAGGAVGAYRLIVQYLDSSHLRGDCRRGDRGRRG